MKWAEFRIHTTQEAVESVSNLLHESGAAGVAIEDPQDLVTEWANQYGEVYELSPADYPTEGVIVKAYFPMGDDFTEMIARVEADIRQLVTYEIDIGAAEMSYVEVDEKDWATAWKAYYHPVQVTERLTIVPTWETYTPNENEMVIELDPGMAFGTGTHPTTILSLQALEKTIKRGHNVIDVGTGSGVLAIAASKLGAETVLALDLDEVAVESAKANVALNELPTPVTVRKNHLLEGIADNTCDVIVANILAEVIVSFTENAYRVLKPGGTFLTSGIITRKKEEVTTALEKAGFFIDEVTEMDDWIAVRAIRKG
ncbi:50S ribosomal protein L11 methyltransferase [Bacillus sp. FSL W7-1360]